MVYEGRPAQMPCALPGAAQQPVTQLGARRAVTAVPERKAAVSYLQVLSHVSEPLGAVEKGLGQVEAPEHSSGPGVVSSPLGSCP